MYSGFRRALVIALRIRVILEMNAKNVFNVTDTPVGHKIEFLFITSEVNDTTLRYAIIYW